MEQQLDMSHATGASQAWSAPSTHFDPDAPLVCASVWAHEEHQELQIRYTKTLEELAAARNEVIRLTVELSAVRGTTQQQQQDAVAAMANNEKSSASSTTFEFDPSLDTRDTTTTTTTTTNASDRHHLLDQQHDLNDHRHHHHHHSQHTRDTGLTENGDLAVDAPSTLNSPTHHDLEAHLGHHHHHHHHHHHDDASRHSSVTSPAVVPTSSSSAAPAISTPTSAIHPRFQNQRESSTNILPSRPPNPSTLTKYRQEVANWTRPVYNQDQLQNITNFLTSQAQVTNLKKAIVDINGNPPSPTEWKAMCADRLIVVNVMEKRWPALSLCESDVHWKASMFLTKRLDEVLKTKHKEVRDKRARESEADEVNLG
ncbi:hypothetical protein OIO90_000392 [Microbotryomycetes sp. JL221]|nr:hypothetical protein OIO90_000392 [Microbotryomycetes sp. JL221]